MPRRQYELIILRLLNNNETCTWGDLKKEINRSTLSIYLNRLINNGYVEKVKFNHYSITSKGENRFLELSQNKEKKIVLNFPPNMILRKRNYDHWILWTLYHNSYCKWVDFIGDPLNINQSSLSKSLNLLMEKDFVRKENKQYRITELGLEEYSNLLKYYDLDRQSILKAESKRIKEITKRTLKFFEKYRIDKDEMKFRFLNILLKLPFEKIISPDSVIEEEDFNKIILFLSINHPDKFPNYISPEQFCKKFNIKQEILDYYIYLIVEKKIYAVKFFTLEAENSKYFFHTQEKLGRMLSIIVEDHITKLTYLNRLHAEKTDGSFKLTLDTTVNAILDEICENLFRNELRETLRRFLPSYINYLAYKIEKEKKLVEPSDKLEGLIWHEIQILENQKLQFDNIKEVERAIKLNPKDPELYYSKSKILIDKNQFNEALALLNKMLEDFPEEEINIQMKIAYIHKEMRNIEAGLDIVNNLIEKYPKNNELINFKALWLGYMEKEDAALQEIQKLIEKEPNNATFYDTYGEILMYFENYKEAIKKFQKAIDIGDEWYFFQTYIKMGLCYKELEDYELAIQNFEKGKELSAISLTDKNTKQKWLAFAEPFIAEISQLKDDFYKE